MSDPFAKPKLPPLHHRCWAQRRISAAALNTPPAVPVTAIYTKSDGIVAWQSSREIEGDCRESITIRGAHGTMVRNHAAWRIIADRLAQAEGDWRPYKAF